VLPSREVEVKATRTATDQRAVIASRIPSTARSWSYWADQCAEKQAGSHRLVGFRCLAKVEVAGSNPVVRSINMQVTAFSGCDLL